MRAWCMRRPVASGCWCARWRMRLARGSSARCPPDQGRARRAAAGADDIILYTQQDFVAESNACAEASNVIYDGVGKSTFEAGFDCLRPRGYMVVSVSRAGNRPRSIRRR